MHRLIESGKRDTLDVVVHVALGLATVMAVGTLFGAILRLKGESPRLAQALFAPAPSLAGAVPGGAVPQLSTNLNHLPSDLPGMTRARNIGGEPAGRDVPRPAI